MEPSVAVRAIFAFLCTTTIAFTSSEETNIHQRSLPSTTDDSQMAHCFFYQRSEYPKDCRDVQSQCSTSNSSGVYIIKPDGFEEPFEVYCNNDVGGGGWTVIQRRDSSSVDFNRSWSEYQGGFGFLSTEFWIGNEKLSYLTNQADYELRVDIEVSYGAYFFTTYSGFRITDEWGQYTITHIGEIESNAADTLIATCPTNMIYGTYRCQATCEDPNGQSGCNSDSVDSEGCTCPAGFLMQGSDCISASECGCFVTDTRLVSFPAPFGGFVKLQPTDFYGIGELTLNFRAQRPSGLIAYLSDANHVNVLVLQLVNGQVEAVFGKENGEFTRLMSNLDSYDNGKRHSVSVSKLSGREVSLRVNDVDETSGKFRTRTTVVAGDLLFIGGLPSIAYNTEALPDLQPFVGCISNVAVGLEVKNFADRIRDHSADYNLCQEEAAILSEQPPVAGVTTTVASQTSKSSASEECRLGQLGSSRVDPLDAGAGFFGATNESRYEYESLGRDCPTEDIMSFGLKTAAEFGVLYYASDNRQFDYTSLYLSGGKLIYSFDYGTGSQEIESDIQVNDNNWHQIRTMRDGFVGIIFVDGVKVGEGILGGSSRYLSVETPLFVGGLPRSLSATDVPPESRVSVIGCIKDFTVVPPRELLSEFEVPQCQGSREPGVFFGQFGGYFVLDATFKFGFSLEISFEIRPRKNSGTLFSVQKPDMDFMFLEMREGELFLTIENGGGEFVATFSPDEDMFSLCDGEWHIIKVVKERHQAYIEVDGVPGIQASGNPFCNEAKANHPLFFGGLPIDMVHDGILESEDFWGCMRKMVIQGEALPISSRRFVGDVEQRSCPVN